MLVQQDKMDGPDVVGTWDSGLGTRIWQLDYIYNHHSSGLRFHVVPQTTEFCLSPIFNAAEAKKDDIAGGLGGTI